MLKGELKIRVRYSDTDQMGYVYYGRYANYYEIARVELFRSLGFSYKKLEDRGIGMPVIEMESKYLMPIKYDENIKIITSIEEVPASKIKFTKLSACICLKESFEQQLIWEFIINKSLAYILSGKSIKHGCIF